MLYTLMHCQLQTRETQVQPEMHLLVQSQVHPYIDPQVHLYMQFQMYYQVQPKFYRQAHIKHIYHCFDAFSLASPGALTISLLLSYF